MTVTAHLELTLNIDLFALCFNEAPYESKRFNCAVVVCLCVCGGGGETKGEVWRN